MCDIDQMFASSRVDGLERLFGRRGYPFVVASTSASACTHEGLENLHEETNWEVELTSTGYVDLGVCGHFAIREKDGW